MQNLIDKLTRNSCCGSTNSSSAFTFGKNCLRRDIFFDILPKFICKIQVLNLLA